MAHKSNAKKNLVTFKVSDDELDLIESLKIARGVDRSKVIRDSIKMNAVLFNDNLSLGSALKSMKQLAEEAGYPKMFDD